ncbi:MAG: hypothetical protein ACYCUM_03510 [Solirubrobacteraceae bacterium]
MRATVALLAASTFGCGLAGCGSGGGGGNPVNAHETADVALQQTFESGRKIQSGRFELELTVSGTGSSVLAEPVGIKASGPFEESGAGKLPRFDVALAISGNGHSLTAGAVSAAGKVYAELEGSAFVLPSSATSALEKSYAQASKAAGKGSTLSALGIEPSRWLTHPAVKGEPTLGGEATTEIEGGLDLSALLKDANRLSGTAGATGLGGATGSLSPSLLSSIAKAVESATVTVWTGNAKHVLRRLTLDASLAPKGEAAKALGGLTSAKLTLAVGLSHIDEPQKIEAPAKARPLSSLIEVLSGIGLVGQKS